MKKNAVVKDLMNEDAFSGYVSNVIHLAVWMQRMDTYREIYDLYIKPQDDVLKARMILKLINYYIGDVDNSEVENLIDNLESRMIEYNEYIDDSKNPRQRYIRCLWMRTEWI